MSGVALVTGILGQDGSYLAELLAQKGYAVHGIERRSASPHPNKKYLPAGVKLHNADVTDLGSVLSVVKEIAPTEIYHLAAQSHVGRSFKEPGHTLAVNAGGTLNIMEAVRLSGIHSRIYVASTSEMFGGVSSKPCNEQTPFVTRSPYAAAKLAGHHLAINYRDSYRMYVSCGILFNHESERRPEEFVTRKITMGIRRVLDGTQDAIRLGNLDARRDWGFAGDYVEGMWRMLQQPHASDYVLATGETHSIREFLDAALDAAGVDSGDVPVVVDPTLYRPAEVNVLIGDATKARTELGWTPTHGFADLVRRMVRHDLAGLQRDQEVTPARTINPVCG